MDGSRAVVIAEVSSAIAGVSSDQLAQAARVLAERRRWFCCGQGRSGLVAAMAAMRLMHAGLIAHVVGEATAPALCAGDGLIAFSATGETPTTVHLARLARDASAHLVVVTGCGSSALAGLAATTIALPTSGSVQFGGTLFEQVALLVLDGLVLDLTADDPHAHELMQRRHANLQ